MRKKAELNEGEGLQRTHTFNDETAAHLFNKSMYSACLISPVLIMMVWKHCLSMAHNFTPVTAEKYIRNIQHQFNFLRIPFINIFVLLYFTLKISNIIYP